MRLFFFTAAIAAFLTPLSAEPLSIDTAKASTQLRLFSYISPPSFSPPFLVGLDITLPPQTHLYGTQPGDVGIPTDISFENSENLLHAHVFWPPPERILENNVPILGYSHSFSLPILVIPRDPLKPIRLRIIVRYATCGQLCIPGYADLHLVLGQD